MADQGVLQKQVYGKLTVTFEEGGTVTSDCYGESVGMIVSQADAVIQRKTMYAFNSRRLPYEIVSFDEQNQRVVVRRIKTAG